ncbi:hypothetical protein R3I94_015982 [Phoxinus phoxinus]
MAAPGMSSQAFLRMLDQRTVRFGRSGNITADRLRKSFLEWEAVRFEVDKLCQEDHFDCPACSPDMVAVSVDGNRKHYRFKSAERSEEQAIFDGVFIANDDDVARFVDYVHTSTSLVSEVEQCNAFLSRIAVTTKHMSKAGRIDMLTVMAMRWNQRKFDNLASTLARRYRKATITLQCQLHNLEAMKMEMDITDNQLESWIIDINEWAEATTSPNDADLAAVASRIEELVASVKRRSQRLYKDNDGCKGRARIRRKIREEKNVLLSLVEKYNTLVPNAEHLTLDTILSDEIVWPWQLTHGDSVDLRTKRKAFDIVMAVRRLEEEKRILIAEMNKHWKSLCTRADTLKHMSSQLSNVTSGETWSLLQDGIQGLQSLTMKNKQASNRLAKHAKNCYVQVLTETEINFDSDSEEYHTSSGRDLFYAVVCWGGSIKKRAVGTGW